MNDTTWHGLIEKCETCANCNAFYVICEDEEDGGVFDESVCTLSDRAGDCSIFPFPEACGGYCPDFWQTRWVMSEEWFGKDVEVAKQAFKEAERRWRRTP